MISNIRGKSLEVTNKTTNKTQLPEFFKLDGKIITDKNDIANKFNTFFTNIGPSLASTITTAGNKTYKSFLNEPSTNEFTFNQITEVDVLNIIDKLPSKASSGVDGLSPILLKHIKNEISRPVTLILNRAVANGPVGPAMAGPIIFIFLYLNFVFKLIFFRPDQ